MRRRHFLRFRDGKPEIRLERGRWERLPGLDEVRVQYVGGQSYILSLGPKSFLTDPGSGVEGVSLVAAGLMLDKLVGFSDPRGVEKVEALRALSGWVQDQLECRFPAGYWTAVEVMGE